MTTKYAVLNPADGTYTYVNTLEEVVEKAAFFALSFYLIHVHDSPYSIVEVSENGAEAWTSPTGEAVLSPSQIEAQIRSELQKTGSFTVSGEIPVTVVGGSA
jgi:hypothetical protein